jgi:hypothetical protein
VYWLLVIGVLVSGYWLLVYWLLVIGILVYWFKKVAPQLKSVTQVKNTSSTSSLPLTSSLSYLPIFLSSQLPLSELPRFLFNSWQSSIWPQIPLMNQFVALGSDPSICLKSLILSLKKAPFFALESIFLHKLRKI